MTLRRDTTLQRYVEQQHKKTFMSLLEGASKDQEAVIVCHSYLT